MTRKAKSKKISASILWQNTWHTMRKTKKRLLALFLMTFLGAFVFVGLATTGPNMDRNLEHFIQESNREHIQLSSAVGLKEEDRQRLEKLEGLADINYYKKASFYFNDDQKNIEINSMPTSLSLPLIKEGRAPQKEDEILLDVWCRDDGIKLGDTVHILSKDALQAEEKKDKEKTAADSLREKLPQDKLKREDFKVVGFAESIHYLSNSTRGSSSFASKEEIAYFGYVLSDVFEQEDPNGAYLLFSDLETIPSYDRNYRKKEEEHQRELRQLFNDRPDQVKADLKAEINTELDDAQSSIDEGWEELDKAKKDLVKARSDLDKGWEEYEDGKADYQEKMAQSSRQLADAKKKLQSSHQILQRNEREYQQGKDQYEAGMAQLKEAENTLKEKKKDLDQGWAQLHAGQDALKKQGASQEGLEKKQKELEKNQAELRAGIEQIDQAINQLSPLAESQPEVQAKLAALKEKKEDLLKKQALLKAGLKQVQQGLDSIQKLKEAESKLKGGQAAYDQGYEEYQKGLKEAQASKEKLDKARSQLDKGWASYKEGLKKLNDGKNALADGKKKGQDKLDEARKKLEDGEADYREGVKKYEEERPDAENKLRDGQEEVKDGRDQLERLEIPVYTVSGRFTDYYIQAHFDAADNIRHLTRIIPVLFYLVAMLVTMTTTRRMVEEERSEIGTLKALGYDGQQIDNKYLFYAALPTLLGSALGSYVAYTALMPVIVKAYFFSLELILPLTFQLDWWPPCLAMVIGLGLSLLTAYLSSRQSLKKTAAQLMRPPMPQHGHRILLERIRPLWKRMNFTAKVTARNLTAKPGRMLMTLLGVCGCTALIAMGFGLRSSIFNMVSKQYGPLRNYTAEVIYDSHAKQEDRDELVEIARQSHADFTQVHLDSGLFIDKDGKSQTAHIIVPMDEDNFSSFRPLRDRKSGRPLPLPEDRALVSESFYHIFSRENKKEESFSIENKLGENYQIGVGDRVESYVGNEIYMSRRAYEKSSHKEADPNALYVRFADQQEWEKARREFRDNPAVLTTVQMDDSKDSVEDLLHSMNYVVAIIIVVSSLLCFVVLFNLTNLNVSERQRELSTIRVLGFTSREVTHYVYRETLILTAIGILLGLGGGKLLHWTIVILLSPAGTLIDPRLEPMSYLIATAITLIFSLTVMLIIHQQLKRVDMVEALKAED